MNDTILKTIDKCDSRCETCFDKANEISHNCLTCNKNFPYLYYGNCLETCENGFYNDSEGILHCNCIKEECQECFGENMEKGVCKTCSSNYYQKEEDLNFTDNYILCYKDPEKYYLENNIYKIFYHSCLSCDIGGDKNNNSCAKCDPKYNFSLSTFDNRCDCFAGCEFYFFVGEKCDCNCADKKGCDRCPYVYRSDAVCCSCVLYSVSWKRTGFYIPCSVHPENSGDYGK